MQKPYAPKMLGGQPNSGNASILGVYGPPTHPLPSKHTSLHVAPRPDLIGSADIAAAALTAFLILDHIISGAVCNQENLGTHCVCN